MTLLEEIKDAFNAVRVEHVQDNEPPIQMLDKAVGLPPLFNDMRLYYGGQSLVITRRGFRHFAGSELSSCGGADELLEATTELMVPQVLAMLLQTFADGVRLGHKEDQIIKMAFHFHVEEHLYGDSNFIEGSKTMALGFNEDDEIRDFFLEYLLGGIEHLIHISGFAHSTVDPNKIWDVWLLICGATIGSCYMAGYQMGSSWRERDVLDGIEIASEDDHGSE